MNRWLPILFLAAGAAALWYWWNNRAEAAPAAGSPGAGTGELTFGNVGHGLTVNV